MSTQAKTEKKTPIKKLHMPKWNFLRLIIQFREEGVAGNQPMDGMLERYTVLVSSGASNEMKAQLEQEGVVSQETVDTYLANCTALLAFDDHGPYIRENQIIGMLCMAGSRTKWTKLRLGMKATLIQGTTRVDPPKLYLRGGRMSIPTRGMNTAMSGGIIKRAQVITGTDPIEFTIRWLDNKDISIEEMKGLVSLGQEIGLGGDRRFGYGRFDILEMKRLNNGCRS